MFTKEQLKERMGFIGASEAAGALGLSRFTSVLSLWAEKTGQTEPSEEETLPQWVGTEIEEIIAKRFTLETGKKVHRVNDTIIHKDYPFLACHIDRKVDGEDAILQCKSASAYKAKEWDNDEIPTEYVIQEYHELACTGYKKAYIACLIGNHKFVIKEVFYDKKVIDSMIAKEVAFWNSFVIPKVMPMQISCKDDDTLLQLFPEAQDTEIELGDGADRVIEGLESMTADFNSLKGQIEQQKNTLKALLQDNSIGRTAKYLVTWKNRKTSKLDTKLLKEEEPKTYEKYLNSGTTRVLLYNTIKEEKNGK
jgi:putative phage-type endonuclease